MGNRYKRQQKVATHKAEVESAQGVIGMLFLVDVRMVIRRSGEKIKKKLLVVGCEAADIERKLRWVFDSASYDEFSVSNVEKVREKVHVISTVYTQTNAIEEPIIKRKEGTVEAPQAKLCQEKYDPKNYAVGITTTMVAKDEQHALRKVANALLVSATDGIAHSASSLSEDATVVIEQIPLSSGYAMPRDVSSEVNRAHFVRG
jgi:hypothetical protein